MHKKDEEVPWKGKEEDRPNNSRCFAIPKVSDYDDFSALEDKQIDNKYFCYLRSSSGTEIPMETAELYKNEFISTFN